MLCMNIRRKALAATSAAALAAVFIQSGAGNASAVSAQVPEKPAPRAATTTGIATISGLKQPGTSDDTMIDLSTAPTYLQNCLTAGTVTQAQYNSACLLPYISGMWGSPEGLLREHKDIAVAANDWLVKKPKNSAWPVYYPGGNTAAKKNISKQLKKTKTAKQVSVRELPDPLPIPGTKAGNIYMNAGLLFLPNSYVVPGGIFNEMYGWDSFFIIKGLLASADYTLDNPNGRYWDPAAQAYVQLNPDSAKAYAQKLFYLAKGMADNHAFEIKYYGGMVNNANRIYYLTRSQPPLFAHEVRAIHDFATANPSLVPYKDTLSKYFGTKPAKNYNQWLSKEMLPAASTYFKYYTDPNHLIFDEKTNPRVAKLDGRNVSLYVTDGIGPAPEITKSKVPGNIGYYKTVKQYFKAYPKANPGHRFMTKKNKLTQLFYRSDRAVRASGYDLSGRFGYVGEWDAMYAPIDLQSLVYQFGKDINKLRKTASNAGVAVSTKKVPSSQLKSMKTSIKKSFWKPAGTASSPSAGHWTDRFVGPGPKQPDPYLYSTTLTPLFAEGLATADEAAKAVQTVTTPREVKQEQLFYAKDSGGKQRAYKITSAGGNILQCVTSQPGCMTEVAETVPNLPLLSVANYGMPMSQTLTGNQWDYPNAWAPVQLFSSDGLRSHGFTAEANAVDNGWINAVDINFAKQGILVEKFVATDPSSAPPVTAGYSANQAGFGWTNAFYMEAWQRQYGTD